MEYRYAEIFIDACSTVLDSFSSRRITSADIMTPDNGSGRSICVSMGMMGGVDGQVRMSMDAETGITLASEMLGGMEITDVDELVTSAVCELCNMIMGNACSCIGADDTSVDITPPVIVEGNVSPLMDGAPDYRILMLLDSADSIDFQVAMESA
ncbi:MAG: chemotaxis protein CheX [Bacillota bacterium]